MRSDDNFAALHHFSEVRHIEGMPSRKYSLRSAHREAGESMQTNEHNKLIVYAIGIDVFKACELFLGNVREFEGSHGDEDEKEMHPENRICVKSSGTSSK